MTEQTTVPKLKFADRHVEPILAGRKESTIRLELPAPDFRIGQRFQFVDEQGVRFASGVVSDRGYENVRWITRHGIDGHRSYTDVDELLEELAEYYPHDNLTPDACLEIVYWEWSGIWE